jgi:hypothetical protein
MLHRLKPVIPVPPKRSEQPAANDAPNSKNDVEKETFPLSVHDLAGDEASYQSEDDPAEE